MKDFRNSMFFAAIAASVYHFYKFLKARFKLDLKWSFLSVLLLLYTFLVISFFYGNLVVIEFTSTEKFMSFLFLQLKLFFAFFVFSLFFFTKLFPARRFSFAWFINIYSILFAVDVYFLFEDVDKFLESADLVKKFSFFTLHKIILVTPHMEYFSEITNRLVSSSNKAGIIDFGLFRFIRDDSGSDYYLLSEVQALSTELTASKKLLLNAAPDWHQLLTREVLTFCVVAVGTAVCGVWFVYRIFRYHL